MSEPLLSAEQWAVLTNHYGGSDVKAALAEIDRLARELAERDELLANVIRDEATGAALAAEAREREACAREAESKCGEWEREGDGESSLASQSYYGMAEAGGWIAAAIRARGPCLPPPPSEGELERLRVVERAARLVVNGNGAAWEIMRDALALKEKV